LHPCKMRSLRTYHPTRPHQHEPGSTTKQISMREDPTREYLQVIEITKALYSPAGNAATSTSLARSGAAVLLAAPTVIPSVLASCRICGTSW
jgi:hypothetical protein